MRCPYCGSVLSTHSKTCEYCGRTVNVYNRLVQLSQYYYNEGLDKAQVRDLSGAIMALKKSLEIDKRNSDARNLLGLIYYEMGEVVEALTQWVLSKNLDPNDNEADYFLEKTQENPTEFDNMNQAVRKYNVALSEARQGHIDLAVIQLRKAVALNGKFVRALQLLSLLYIRNSEYNKAEKLIKKGLKIDIANTTLLRYLQEITPEGNYENGEGYFSGDESDDGKKKSNGIFATFSYKEDKPSVMPFVNLVIGVIIGVLVVYYLIVPTVKDNIREEYANQKVDYSAELGSKAATITQQEKTIKNLNKRIAELEAANPDSTGQTGSSSGNKKGNYNDFFAAMEMYNTLMSREYDDSELQELALNLWRVDDTKITNSYASEMLVKMRNDVYGLAAKNVYKTGRKLYDDASYNFAVEILSAAVDMDPSSDTSIYYLAKSYQALGENAKAIENYQHMLEVCPNSTLKEYVPERLKECGYTE